VIWRADRAVFALGGAPCLGSMAGLLLARPVVAVRRPLGRHGTQSRRVAVP